MITTNISHDINTSSATSSDPFHLAHYLSIFMSTLVKYIDSSHNFAYSIFSNKSEQIASNILTKSSKAIIFDTRTGYINVKVFINQFHDDQFNKSYSDICKNKSFREIMSNIESIMNSHSNIDTKYYKLPFYNIKSHRFTASYDIRPTTKSANYAGKYVHPDMVTSILTQINNTFNHNITLLISSILLNEGVNELVTLTSIINSQQLSLINDSTSYRQIISSNDIANNIPNDQSDQFNMIEYYKSLSFIESYNDEINLNHSSPSINSSNKRQIILIVRHYDSSGEFMYGTNYYKLSLILINENDLEAYLKKYNKPNPQTDDEVLHDILSYESEVIHRISLLKDVVINFSDIFVSIYEEKIDIWTLIEKDKKYICTIDLPELIRALIEFTIDWQII